MFYYSQIPPHIREKRRVISLFAIVVSCFLAASVLLYLYSPARISEMFLLLLSPWTNETFRILFIAAMSELLVLRMTEWIRGICDERGEWKSGNVVFALQSAAIVVLLWVDLFFLTGIFLGQWQHVPVRIVGLIGLALAVDTRIAANAVMSIL